MDDDQARRHLLDEHQRLARLRATLENEHLHDEPEEDSSAELSHVAQHPADAASDAFEREKEFSILFHEGERDNIHISIVAQRVILVVIFDERSSLGLVRLRVKKASQELSDVFARIMSKVEREKAAAGSAFESPFAEITDEDIDSLFSE